MISSIISRLVILIFGTLYPVYASYKAVRSKDVKGYVQWMMYWIVFGLFTCTETITDIFLSWFPFYYEIKIIVVLWLLSPATKGSSILYRKFVHPTLSNREQEIDECISKAKQQTYRQVLDLGSKGMTVLMQTALKFFTEFPLKSGLIALPSHDKTDHATTLLTANTDETRNVRNFDYSDDDATDFEVQPDQVLITEFLEEEMDNYSDFPKRERRNKRQNVNKNIDYVISDDEEIIDTKRVAQKDVKKERKTSRRTKAALNKKSNN